MSFDPNDLTGRLDPATWFDVIPTDGWDNVLISNFSADAITVRVNGKTLTVAAGKEQPIVAVYNRQRQRYRFMPGIVAFQIKPASGTGSGVSILYA